MRQRAPNTSDHPSAERCCRERQCSALLEDALKAEEGKYSLARVRWRISALRERTDCKLGPQTCWKNVAQFVAVFGLAEGASRSHRASRERFTGSSHASPAMRSQSVGGPPRHAPFGSAPEPLGAPPPKEPSPTLLGARPPRGPAAWTPSLPPRPPSPPSPEDSNAVISPGQMSRPPPIRRRTISEEKRGSGLVPDR